MAGKGFQVFVADGAVDTSGQAVVVYAINVVGGSAVVNLRNGTTASATSIIRLNVPADPFTGSFDFGGVGLVFPSGCFVDVDSNTTQATIVYERL